MNYKNILVFFACGFTSFFIGFCLKDSFVSRYDCMAIAESTMSQHQQNDDRFQKKVEAQLNALENNDRMILSKLLK